MGQNYQEVLASKDRVTELLSLKKSKFGDVLINKVNKINIINLFFSYGKTTIFKNFNYKFDKGNIYTIIGSNGSGKTTLFKIITGLYRNYKGEVRINNIDIKKIDIREFRAIHMNIVSQNLYGPFMTVERFLKDYFNIDRYMIEESKVIIKNIATVTLDNYNKMCNTLSGGELRKLYLLAALLIQKDIIILDEPTTGLDTLSKNELINTLKTFSKNSIIIIIIHDKDLIKNSDVVIDLNEKK